MGNDHDARKRAKKRRAVEFEDGAGEGGDGRRVRKRRPAIRRLCRGMCYGEPALTSEDLAWTEEAGEDEGPASERRSRHTQLLEEEKQRAAEEAQREAERAKKRQRRAASKQRRLSTAVNLIDPDEDAGTPEGGAGPADASAALRAFPAAVQRCMAERGFSEPTPIQERCWPVLLEGSDLAASAEPGSGKTLAYLMPAACVLERLADDEQPAAQPGCSPAVLVLVPTRELAQQVAVECRCLRKCLGARCVAIVGGADKEAQLAALQQAPQLVVATPGRLLELLEERALRLDAVRYVVLDEADKMLSLGLQPQLRRLRALLLPKAAARLQGPVKVPRAPSRARPQVALFSATLTEEALGVAHKWLRRPQRVHLGATAADISRSVVQAVHVCAEHKKPAKLLKHLAHIKEKGAGMRNAPRVLIFANRIKTVRFLQETVSGAGLRCVMLHGERTQPEREEAMRDFRSGKAQAMVATDVAARGLHIRGLPYVVNYDFPLRIEQYIHRAGRTGRLAANGHCFSFFTRNLAPLAQPLLDLLTEHKQAVDPNLVLLADAYKQAVQKLQAPEASEDEAAEPDVLAELLGEGAAGQPSAADGAPAAASPLPEPAEADKEQAAGEAAAAPAAKASKAGGKAKAGKAKALPGRLRKKLARDKARAGA